MISAKGADTSWVCGEGVPGAARSLDDRLGIGEKPKREEALAQVKPDPLDRIEFWAVGRQWHEREITGDGQRARVVPAGTVKHEHGMSVGRECGGELRQKEIHHCGTDDRQHQSEVLARGGTSLADLRSSSLAAQALLALSRRASRITAVAPMT